MALTIPLSVSEQLILRRPQLHGVKPVPQTMVKPFKPFKQGIRRLHTNSAFDKDARENFTLSGVRTFPCDGGFCDGCGTCCENDHSGAPCCPLEGGICCPQGGCCPDDGDDGQCHLCGEHCMTEYGTCCSPNDGTYCEMDEICCGKFGCCDGR